MTAAFIIAEYNPFHRGHEYHIAKTREELAPDAMVCVMSGHFTQRGSASVADKWARARMALHAGADIVLELHPVYACSSAEGFARGALKTAACLTEAGGWLSFGAECTDTGLLSEFAQILRDEPVQYKALLGSALGSGKSYAAARQEALADYYPGISAPISTPAAKSRSTLTAILKAPNNILAIEYIRAINTYGLPFTPHAIPRIGRRSTEAHDANIRTQDAINRASDGYAGASEIRGMLREKYGEHGNGCDWRRSNSNTCQAKIEDALPQYSVALLNAEFSMGRGPVFDEHFYPQLKTIFLREAPEYARAFADVSEGLENRLYKAMLASSCYGGLISLAGSRRYPDSRIRRILTRILLGYKAGVLGTLDVESGPPYLRVLGFSAAGRKLLASAKASVPVITNYKALRRADPRSKEFMRLEARATDIYAAAYQNPAFRASGQDFIRSPARL